MAYANIREVGYQAVTSEAALEDNTLVFTLTDVPAGATVVVVGASIPNDYSANCFAQSASSSPAHTWVVNEKEPTSGPQATAWSVHGENLSAGTYTLTVTLNRGSLNTLTNRVTAVAFIIADAATDSISSPVEGESNANTNSMSLSSGALPQTDCYLIGIACGAVGTLSLPTGSGWQQYYATSNGGLKVGTLIAARKTTVADAVTFQANHDLVADARYRTMMIVVVKAKAGATRRYRCSFDPLLLNNTHGAHTVWVYRNCDPDTGLAEKFTNITATVDGDIICSPADAAAQLADTVKFLVVGGGGSVGLPAGVVEDIV